jgi:hypothetical protein
VARYYRVSPHEVENIWTNVEFIDRREYMDLQNEIDRQYQKFVENNK